MSIQVETPLAFKGRDANLTEASQRQLRQVFRALKEAQRIELIQIKAHTDNDGKVKITFGYPRNERKLSCAIWFVWGSIRNAW